MMANTVIGFEKCYVSHTHTHTPHARTHTHTHTHTHACTHTRVNRYESSAITKGDTVTAISNNAFKCYHCGMDRHISRNCPNKLARERIRRPTGPHHLQKHSFWELGRQHGMCLEQLLA